MGDPALRATAHNDTARAACPAGGPAGEASEQDCSRRRGSGHCHRRRPGSNSAAPASAGQTKHRPFHFYQCTLADFSEPVRATFFDVQYSLLRVRRHGRSQARPGRGPGTTGIARSTGSFSHCPAVAATRIGLSQPVAFSQSVAVCQCVGFSRYVDVAQCVGYQHRNGQSLRSSNTSGWDQAASSRRCAGQILRRLRRSGYGSRARSGPGPDYPG
jgi:hypothetical protein